MLKIFVQELATKNRYDFLLALGYKHEPTLKDRLVFKLVAPSRYAIALIPAKTLPLQVEIKHDSLGDEYITSSVLDHLYWSLKLQFLMQVEPEGTKKLFEILE